MVKKENRTKCFRKAGRHHLEGDVPGVAQLLAGEQRRADVNGDDVGGAKLSGLTVKDLVPSIGQPNRVYEVLNRKRGLTIQMIRNLHRNLGIPAESLIGV